MNESEAALKRDWLLSILAAGKYFNLTPTLTALVDTITECEDPADPLFRQVGCEDPNLRADIIAYLTTLETEGLIEKKRSLDYLYFQASEAGLKRAARLYVPKELMNIPAMMAFRMRGANYIMKPTAMSAAA